MRRFKKSQLSLLIVLSALLCLSVSVYASNCDAPDNGTGTVDLPALCPYIAPFDNMRIIDGLPPGTTIELEPCFDNFVCDHIYSICSEFFPPGICEQPGGSLGGTIECFEGTVVFIATGTGMLTGFSRTLAMDFYAEIHNGPRNPGDALQVFPSDWFRLEAQLFGDPDFCTFHLISGTDFGLPCPGQTSLEELPSGDFAVDSFFDITYQIDFEGCPGSVLDGFMGTTVATVRLVQGFGAQTIYAGDDLFDCPPDSNTYFDFNTYPLPADFFYPGSDPFDQMTILEGNPLETNPAYALSPTSVIIRRLDDAHFDSCGDSDTIQTEIVALSLVGVSPITITGMGPDQQWQVSLCLSSIAQQDIGSMAVYLDCDSGGVFDGQLRVIPKLMFDQIDPPFEHREWDFGYAPEIVFYYTTSGHWLYSDPGFGVITSPGGLSVDHDCDASTMDVAVNASSNFFGCLYGTPCDCSNNPTAFDMLMTYYNAPYAGLGLMPAIEEFTVDISPGFDLYVTLPDSNTFIIFGGVDCPPIPADFFGPGSDPFDGTVVLEGQPLETTPADNLGPTDTIIKRLTSAEFPSCGSSDDVDIEIVALSLISVSPIEVTAWGGTETYLYDVRVCLSSIASQPTGTMTINLECEDGGTFEGTLPVIPQVIFLPISSPYGPVIWDFGNDPIILTFESANGYWTYFDPGLGIITSPGGLTANHDCNPMTPEIPIGPSSNFYPCVMADPCDCFNPAASYELRMTYWYADCAGLGLLPPTGLVGYAYLPGDANMANGLWPPAVIGGDVTYLVNYFKGSPSSNACLLDGFWASADVNADCIVMGSDVIRMVAYFRGVGLIENCIDYPPMYPPMPNDPPVGWPNCD